MQTQLSPRDLVANPEMFAAAFLKIQDKNKKLIPFTWNAAQKDFNSRRTGRDLILKARQLGFSTYIQGEIFRRIVTSTRTAITLAHDNDTTTKLRLMADRFYEHCKFNGIQPSRKYANASLASYPEHDSEFTIGTAGNIHAGRGGTYTDFHGSEVAFWGSAEDIIAGAMQGGDPEVCLESTPNGAQGFFYERCMEALRGDGVWRLHFYPWWWDPAYRLPLNPDEILQYDDEELNLIREHSLTPEQINWRRYKIKELRELFKQEYPEDPITCFLTSGNSYFGDISGFFTAPLNPRYDPTHIYVAGLDFGQSNDFTSMPVLDLSAKVMVDLLHVKKLSWREQRRRIASQYKKWHLRKMGVEMNSVGSVNFEKLQEIEIYPGKRMNCVPFWTTNDSKNLIMSELYEGLHSEGWRLQDIPEVRHEMQTFVSSQTPTGLWRLAASGSNHDDNVISLAIAKWVTRVASWESVKDLGKVPNFRAPIGAEDEKINFR
jgi:hypothetical protein